ncbi:MAG: response regulator [Gemmatimonadota bacterium]
MRETARVAGRRCARGFLECFLTAVLRPGVSPAHRVLVIEDEPAIRMALRRFFGRIGWTVEEAANGNDGYAMVRLDARQREQRHYAIVFSDLRMPGLSGIGLHERLRLTNPEVLPRLIFSTGDDTSEEVARFIEESECVVLRKPFDLVTLRAVVELMLTRAPA